MWFNYIYCVLLLISCNYSCGGSLEASVNLAAQITRKYFGSCTILQTTNAENLIESNEYFRSFDPITHSNSFFVWNFNTITIHDSYSSYAFYNRYGPHCLAVIATFDWNHSPSLDKFLAVFTPRINPITRRDQDYFVFISKSRETCDKILNSNILQRELKFKVVIYPDQKLFTNCFYCKSEIAKLEIKSEHTDLRSLFPDFTTNFHGYSLKVTAPTKYEPVYQMQFINEVYRNKRGIHTFIFNILQDKLNFTYELHPCSNEITGRLAKNGTWLGCVGDLVYRRSELSLSVGPDLKRDEYLSITAPIHYRYITFVVHKPRSKYQWNTVFRTFDDISWVLVALSIVLTGAIVFASDTLLTSKKVKYSNIASNLLHLFGYLLCQSLDINPGRWSSSYMVLTMWLFCAFVLSSYYSTGLQSLIVIPGYEFVPTNIEELLTSGFKWGCSRQFQSGLGWELLKSSEHPTIRHVFNEIERDESDMDCLSRSASTSENYACFNWDNHYEFYAGTQLQEKDGHEPLQTAMEKVMFMVMVWSARKREVFLKVFDEFLNRQFAMGIWQKLLEEDRTLVRNDMMRKDKEVFSRPRRKKRMEKNVTFSFQEAKACFIVLAFGVVVAVAQFALERQDYTFLLSFCSYIVSLFRLFK